MEPARFIEKARSRIAEGARLTLNDYRSVAIPLFASLSSTTTTGSDNWKVPNGWKFAITDILPHVAVNIPDTELDGFGIFTTTGVENTLFQTGLVTDRIFSKALNCRAKLIVSDDQTPIFSTRDFSLVDLMGAPGGEQPYLDEDYPLVLPSNATIQLDLTLQDTNATGNATEYGVLLVGALIAVEPSDRVLV